MRIGIPLQAQDKNGNSALHLAAKVGNLAVAKALVKTGANVTARNKNNRTPKMMVRSSQACIYWFSMCQCCGSL